MWGMGERIRVLHVNDDPNFAELTAESLERAGDRLEVETAGGAEEGLELLGTVDVDCIVSDYEMPGTDGLEFLAAVRERRHELPFILFTGEGSEAVASDAISAGVTDYVRKGVGSDQFTVLANRVENAVEQHRTERRLRERDRELARQNNRLRALFENFPEPTLAYVYEDDEPYVTDVNDAFAAVFGYDEATAVGEPVDDLVVPPDRREEARRVDQRVRDGEAVDELLRRRTTDGLRTFRFRNVRLSDDESIDGYAVYADVTDRVRRERELQRQNERLEEFASVVSHDLRNPLKVAEGRLSLAAEECDSDHLEDVAAAHERIDVLVEDLLTFAREGSPVGEVEPVDLAALADTCWGHVGTAGASLSIDTDATVHADRSRLQRLLENLLRNAVDHGSTSPPNAEDAVDHGSTSPPNAEDAVDRGDDAVAVTVGDLPDGRGFYVADDGTGIPADQHDRVFEGGYSTSDDGTGLGLAIVQGIAEAHDWTVSVTDSDAGGARFEVSGVDTSGCSGGR